MVVYTGSYDSLIPIAVIIFIVMNVIDILKKYYFERRHSLLYRRNNFDYSKWIKIRLIGGIIASFIFSIYLFIQFRSNYLFLSLSILILFLNILVYFFIVPRIAFKHTRSQDMNRKTFLDKTLRKNITPGTEKEGFYLIVGLTIVLLCVTGVFVYQIFNGAVNQLEVIRYIVFPIVLIAFLWIFYFYRKNYSEVLNTNSS